MNRRTFLTCSAAATASAAASGTFLPSSLLTAHPQKDEPDVTAIHIGAQYYRAPFPEKKFWKEDLLKMAGSGMNTVQLWILWGWVEPAPDQFRFDDYDELVTLAGQSGLKVVLSTIAAIQPLWIHREVPGSELVDNFGKKVISSNREETHFGITPGGCFDHPGIQERMDHFFRTTVSRYRGESHLHGWDVWNELRWGVNSDGLVCFCEHTIENYYRWLKEKYEDLDQLNVQWKTRYTRWGDIRPPKVPRSPYTDDLFYGHYMMDRASRHGWHRFDVVKSEDPVHPVTLHGGRPAPLFSGRYDPDHNLPRFPMWRGNDWTFAEKLDAIGTSSFPKLFQDDDLRKFTMRIDFTRSARSGKRIWMSELQGGRGNLGFNLAEPVQAGEQQRWLWTGISQGVDTILFWCWRDEVFGQESDGYGIAGNDGFAPERLAAMRRTGNVLRKNHSLFSGYRPDTPEVGIWFGPQNYFLHWAQNKRGDRAMNAIMGYADACLEMKIPYRIIEENHLDEMDGLKVLFMPQAMVLHEKQEKILIQFVENGGILVCESWTGAFTSEGFYRYPEDRFLCRHAGICEIGRRAIAGHESENRKWSNEGNAGENPFENAVEHRVDSGITISYRDRLFRVEAEKWITPMRLGSDGIEKLLIEVPHGKGRIIAIGSFFGTAYQDKSTGQLPELVASICESAGIQSVFRTLGQSPPEVQIKSGRSGQRRIHFILAETDQPVHIQWQSEPGISGVFRELLSGKILSARQQDDEIHMQVPASPWGVWVLAEE